MRHTRTGPRRPARAPLRRAPAPPPRRRRIAAVSSSGRICVWRNGRVESRGFGKGGIHPISANLSCEAFWRCPLVSAFRAIYAASQTRSGDCRTTKSRKLASMGIRPRSAGGSGRRARAFPPAGSRRGAAVGPAADTRARHEPLSTGCSTAGIPCIRRAHSSGAIQVRSPRAPRPLRSGARNRPRPPPRPAPGSSPAVAARPSAPPAPRPRVAGVQSRGDGTLFLLVSARAAGAGSAASTGPGYGVRWDRTPADRPPCSAGGAAAGHAHALHPLKSRPAAVPAPAGVRWRDPFVS
jgi:hypothetical protein